MDASFCFDDDGYFKSPEMAAFHATYVQGGFSSPEREAVRMLKDGGRYAEIARAWIKEKGLDEEELKRSYS